MIFTATDVVGVYRLDLEPVADERGFFARAWCRREFTDYGVDDELVQVNLAFSRQRGTLRGLHFQAPPHAETKFVRCVHGAALVVAVDLRPDSPTYLKWTSLELSADNRRAMLVPQGCAQGYQTLEVDTEMLYQMSAYYVPAAARGVRYDDPAFGIRWPLPPRGLSDRDQSWPNYVIERHDACRLEKNEPTQGSAGRKMFALVTDLFPICRSIAGPGLRETLHRIAKHVPLELHEVPTGTQVLDWSVPREWYCRDAYIKNSGGERLVDFQVSNLHVVNYSVPIRHTVSRDELLRHVHSLPNHPDWIPYRTSYYDENWGFCLTERQREALRDDQYEVVIDSVLKPGSLTYGECCLPGETDKEVLISCHACHPSLANDNLSAIAVAVELIRLLADRPRRYTYRFLFAPGTIGAIAWLSHNAETIKRIRHGLVLALLGRPGPLVYKRSRRGDAPIDRVAAYVLEQSSDEHRLIDFEPYGYDERQFCSPGFNLSVGRLTRAPQGEYPEYHTSADNLDLVCPETLEASLAACVRIIDVLEHNRVYQNLSPYGEPQLGRRGLYRATGGELDSKSIERALLWVLNLADGAHSTLDMAQRSGLDFAVIRRASELLVQHELVKEAE